MPFLPWYFQDLQYSLNPAIPIGKPDGGGK